MKARHGAALVILGLIGALGCGANIDAPPKADGTFTCPPPEPKNHRAVVSPCGLPPMPKACATSADCPPMLKGAGVSGTCVTSGANKVCDYNQCTSDGDCTGGKACSCWDQTFGYAHESNGSVCVASNCHTDKDCGPGGFCSPTVDPECGVFYGVQGYYCHTCKDTCIDDSDCPAQGSIAGYCAFDPAVGHWACGNRACSG
jgi:hypothetical protein